MYETYDAALDDFWPANSFIVEELEVEEVEGRPLPAMEVPEVEVVPLDEVLKTLNIKQETCYE